MTAKHTPGPWFVSEWDDEMNLAAIVSHEPEVLGEGQSALWPDGIARRTIADTAEAWFDYDTSRANARLIAAAPDLLEALRDMTNGWQYIRRTHGDLYGVGWDRAEDKAIAALNKAYGEPQA